MMKKDMESHMKKTCINRKFECSYCKTTVTFKFLNHHHTKCKMFPVTRKFCKQQVVRREMNEHVSKDETCPNSPLECEFSEAGCQFIGNRNEMTIHVQNELASHLSLLMKQQSNTKSSLESLLSATKSLLSSTRASLAKKECELEHLKSFVTEKIGMPVSQPDICVFDWNITNWSNWRNKAELNPFCKILSEPFHTEPQGYKLLLVLYPAGLISSRGSHVFVSVLMHSTDYTTKLHTKQHCKFSFTLIDQQPDAMNVVVIEEKTLKHSSRPFTVNIQLEGSLQV